MSRLPMIATATLLGLLVASAPGGQTAVAKDKDTRPIAEVRFQERLSYSASHNKNFNPVRLTIDEFYFLLSELIGKDSPQAEGSRQRLRQLKLSLSVAEQSLRDGQKKGFDRARKQLKTSSVYAKDFEIRESAQDYLRGLPKSYVTNVATVNEDGTVACDPDPFIRLQLQKDEYNIRFSGDNF